MTEEKKLVVKKAFKKKELERLERVRQPMEEELKQVKEKIKIIKKELRTLKNVPDQKLFLF